MKISGGNIPRNEDKEKVFYRLKNGIIISNIDDCPTDSGLYLLYPKFEIGNRYKWLKVGMTVDRKGLKKRIRIHNKSKLNRVIKKSGDNIFIDTESLTDQERKKLTPSDVKSRFSSILGKHLWFDFEFSKRFGLNLTKQIDRQKFLQENCYFIVLPLPQFNWKTKEERRIKKIALKKYECWIEDRYKHEIRYIGRVKIIE